MTSITLTNGHNYLVMTTGTITGATLSGTTLSFTNSAQIDLIDLGAGTRSTGPSVCLVTSEGVSSL